jgi:hypothetical protein
LEQVELGELAPTSLVLVVEAMVEMVETHYLLA